MESHTQRLAESTALPLSRLPPRTVRDGRRGVPYHRGRRQVVLRRAHWHRKNGFHSFPALKALGEEKGERIFT